MYQCRVIEKRLNRLYEKTLGPVYNDQCYLTFQEIQMKHEILSFYGNLENKKQYLTRAPL